MNIAITPLQHKVSYNSQEFFPIVKGILSVLAMDPLTVTIQIKLAVVTLPWNELAQFFIDLNNKQQLHPDALVTAVSSIESVYQRNNIAEIINLETTLAASEDEKLRRIALAALIAQTNSHLGWDRDRVDRLLKYRQDRSILVAAAAQFTFPPDKIIADV